MSSIALDTNRPYQSASFADVQPGGRGLLSATDPLRIAVEAKRLVPTARFLAFPAF